MTSTKDPANGSRPRGSRSRRLAERWLDAPTIERVITPAIADLQHESALAPESRLVIARAYWGLWKAIALCVADSNLRLARPTIDGIVYRMMFGVPLVTALLMAPAVSGAWSRTPSVGVLLIALVPQSFVLALPIAYFFAVALDREARQPLRVLPSIVGMSIACTLVAIVAVFVVIPRANVAYRSAVYEQFQTSGRVGRVNFEPGGSEMTIGELVRQSRIDGKVGQRARTSIATRVTICALPLVLGILAFGLADRHRKLGVTFVQCLWLLMFYAAALRSAAGSVVTPPSLANVWLVHFVFLAGGLAMTWVRARSEDYASDAPKMPEYPTRL